MEPFEVLRNIIRNRNLITPADYPKAVKIYAPENKEVTVAVTRENDSIVIEIRDRGPGVPEAEPQRIFEPFYRVSRCSGGPRWRYSLGSRHYARLVSLHAGLLLAKSGPDGGLLVRTPFQPLLLRLPRPPFCRGPG